MGGVSILKSLLVGAGQTHSWNSISKKWLSTASPGAVEPELWEDPAGIWAEHQAFKPPRPTWMAIGMVMMAWLGGRWAFAVAWPL